MANIVENPNNYDCLNKLLSRTKAGEFCSGEYLLQQYEWSFYENVPGSINWATALANAANKSYFGRVGYLATITTLAETNFLWKIMASDSWMGASDDFNYINAATGTTTYANQAA